MFKLMGKEIVTILHSKYFLIWHNVQTLVDSQNDSLIPMFLIFLFIEVRVAMLEATFIVCC